MDLYIGMNDEATENLSIGIRQQTNIDNIIVNVYFLSFSQEEKIKVPSLENRKNFTLMEPQLLQGKQNKAHGSRSFLKTIDDYYLHKERITQWQQVPCWT